jgi:hypothetical protein
MDKRSEKNADENKHTEQVEINIFGLKIKCVDPSSKTIIIIIVFLAFILLLVLLLPHSTAFKWITG